MGGSLLEENENGEERVGIRIYLDETGFEG